MLPENPVIKKHSKLGIASTIIGAGLPVLLIILLVNSAIWDRSSDLESGFAHGIRNAFLSSVGIVLLIALPLHLTGLIFALVGYFSKKTKKSFPVAGFILNAVFGLLGIGIGVLLVRMLLSISHN